jgi:hypothetical protein
VISATTPAVVEPTEAAMLATIRDAARFTGWRIAHFRPARTRDGWVTAVSADGAGFPDLVMVHPRAGVWFVELKSKRGRLSPEQVEWRDALHAAHASWIECRGKFGLDGLLDVMFKVDAAR